jgi:hypothetical protein
VNQELEMHVFLINEGIKEYGAPPDLGEMFDCSGSDAAEATYHKYEVLWDSTAQYALGFIAAVAMIQGVPPESLLKPPKPKRTRKKAAKKAPKQLKGERKTGGEGTVIKLHRGGKE